METLSSKRFYAALGGILTLGIMISASATPAEASGITTTSVKGAVAGAVGTFTGATIGTVVAGATAATTGPASVGIGAVTGIAAGAAASALTIAALNHPATTYAVVTNPVGSAISAVTPKTGVVGTILKVLSWL